VVLMSILVDIDLTNLTICARKTSRKALLKLSKAENTTKRGYSPVILQVNPATWKPFHRLSEKEYGFRNYLKTPSMLRRKIRKVTNDGCGTFS